jgi:hypothetical protein
VSGDKVEYAAGSRGQGTYPAAWGTPPGTPLSSGRAQWVRSHIPLSPRVAQRRLAARNNRLLWSLRFIEFERKGPTP